MSLIAVGDESMRQRQDGSGIYVIAAPLFESGRAPDLRAEMATLARRKLPFHWREAGPVYRHRAIADIVAGAVTSAWGDADDSYVRPLEAVLEVQRIGLD